jgi:D-alanyl-D-alanine carboxypeptidase
MAVGAAAVPPKPPSVSAAGGGFFTGVASEPVPRRTTLAAVAVLTAGSCAVTQCAAPTPGDLTVTTTSSMAPQPTSAAPATARPAPTVVPTATGPVVSDVTAAELGESWRPGCPVVPAQLRRVTVAFVGFDGARHRGDVVVHEEVVPAVIDVFARLLALRYPIERMQPVDHYPGAADELSMEDNNTSAFNCRPLPGSSRWSWHAYGRAIDVNPLLNPYLDRRGNFEPHNAAPFLDRRRTDPGILHAGDPAVAAFTDRGWTWGGAWRTPKDYQHFERP